MVADRVGPECGARWVGGSVICDIDGSRAAGPEFGAATVLLADVDVAGALDKQISPRNHIFTDRRLDLYGPIGDSPVGGVLLHPGATPAEGEHRDHDADCGPAEQHDSDQGQLHCPLGSIAASSAGRNTWRRPQASGNTWPMIWMAPGSIARGKKMPEMNCSRMNGGVTTAAADRALGITAV